jgi:serine/threonine protein kinase
MINTTIGKYKLTRLIGEGGMASVYEAEHEMLGTKVAIKVLNPILSANAQIKERFRNEARLMASLDHPNITKVIDFDEQPQQLSIVMEYLQGEDLNQKIKRYGPLSEKEITDVFSQTLSAFQYAHEKGIVHRDIKPSNIFILPNGHIKILDFGIAKLFGQGNEMTQTGTQMGTPIYMSPEQVKADKSIDHRSDIYSLGVTLFFAINGKAPYNSDTDSQFDIFNKIVYEQLPEISGTSYLNDLIKKACTKDRNLRFQYCQEWIEALNSKEVSSTQTMDKTVVEAPASDKTIVETASAPTADKIVVETQSKPEDKPIIKSSLKASETAEKPKNNKVLVFSILGVLTIVMIVGGVLFFDQNDNDGKRGEIIKSEVSHQQNVAIDTAETKTVLPDSLMSIQEENVKHKPNSFEIDNTGVWQNIISSTDNSNISNAIYLINQVNTNLGSDAYGISDKNIVNNLIRSPKLQITTTDLFNFTKVRSIQGGNLGIFTYDFFSCKFKEKNGKIFFQKTSGSQRCSGYLYRKDDNSFVLLGGWTVNSDPLTNYNSSNSQAGILYKISQNKLILIFSTKDAYEIYEIVK